MEWVGWRRGLGDAGWCYGGEGVGDTDRVRLGGRRGLGMRCGAGEGLGEWVEEGCVGGFGGGLSQGLFQRACRHLCAWRNDKRAIRLAVRA